MTATMKGETAATPEEAWHSLASALRFAALDEEFCEAGRYRRYPIERETFARYHGLAGSTTGGTSDSTTRLLSADGVLSIQVLPNDDKLTIRIEAADYYLEERIADRMGRLISTDGRLREEFIFDANGHGELDIDDTPENRASLNSIEVDATLLRSVFTRDDPHG